MKELFLMLSRIKRRWIFLWIVLAIVFPLLFPFKLPQRMSPTTKSVYDFIESLPESSVVLLSIDFGPSVLPEVQPMLWAILRHCFYKNLRVLGIALYPEGVGLGLDAFEKIAKEMGKEYGVDYAYLGFKAGVSVVMQGIGENIRSVFPKDYYGTPIDSLPIMNGVVNYDDIKLVVSFAGGAAPNYWITYAYTQYGANIAAGVTAVMAADFFPFVQTGQLIGFLGGMKGAAEYEDAVQRLLGENVGGKAILGMNGIAITHLIFILLIILGNIGFFIQRRQ
jgi:hypothetical protein